VIKDAAELRGGEKKRGGALFLIEKERGKRKNECGTSKPDCRQKKKKNDGGKCERGSRKTLKKSSGEKGKIPYS